MFKRLHILPPLLLTFCLRALADGNDNPAYINYTQNKGQWNPKVLYQGDFRGGRAFLEQKGFTFIFYPEKGLSDMHPHEGGVSSGLQSQVLTFHTVKMEFAGCQSAVTAGGGQKSFYQNYFIGQDKQKWAGQVPVYESVQYNSLYPGISAKVFSDLNNFRYDFMVSAHADPSQIKLHFTGQDHLSLRDGKLIIGTQSGEISQLAPKSYQVINGKQTKVECQYTLSKDMVGIKITGNYDIGLPLIIDPTIAFSTYTGSHSDNWGMSATYDLQGNGYTSGVCFGTNYPVTAGAFQASFGGGIVNSTYTYMGFDIVVSKFNSTGSSLLFSTYLGGSDNEEPQSIIVDNNDNLLVLGRTYSSNFPVTAGAYSGSLKGGADIIITKFNANGTALIGSTFFGGSSDDGVNVNAYESFLGSLKFNYADDGRGDIIIDQANNIYVASCTQSTDMPVTPGCLQVANGGGQDACIFKFNPSLTSLLFSTYLGGNANDAAYNLALDSHNDMYVTGGTESSNFPTTAGVLHPSYSGNIDGFLCHISNNGTILKQSTYIGTSAYDQSFFVQTDKFNNVYVYGQTSGSYPITAGVYSNPNSGQFIHELDPTLSSTKFSTEIGTGSGIPDIAPSAFLVDNCQNIYLSGWGGTLGGFNRAGSTTVGLPITSGAYQTTTDGNDFYFMVLTKNANALWYATFYGGPQSEEHVDGGTSRFDKSGVIYQAICEGCGGYSDLPTTPGAWSNTNNSFNCNNALVKFKFDMRETVSLFSTNPSVTGCAPFNVSFQNHCSNAVSYSWDFGDGTNAFIANPVHMYANPGTYTITLIAIDTTTCNMRDTSYSFVRVVPPVTVSVSSPSPLCKSDSTHLVANSPLATSFLWSPATGLNSTTSSSTTAHPSQTTNYLLTVKDSFCVATASVTVQIIPSHNPVLISGATNLCLGDSIKLSVSGGPFSSYNWSTGQSLPAIEALHGGVYIVHTLDSNGCKGLDSLRITGFTPVALTGKDTTICDRQFARLLATKGNYTYQWAPAASLNNATIYNPIAQPHTTTNYTVTVTNGPCISTQTMTIFVNPIPVLSVKPDSVNIMAGENVVLQAFCNVPCTWSPNEQLTCTNCYTTTASPETNMTYYITSINEIGCSVTDSVRIYVEPSFYVPNSFTPNGDNLNDIFKPVFSGYTEIDAYIFNRWGEQIYHWNNLEGGWDGTFRGTPSQQDVYTYTITAKDYKHRELQKSGTVALVR